MQTTGRMPACSAVTSSRSIRFGFSRGSAALATISSLVDVGHDDVLPAATGAADAPAARLDPFDDPLARCRRRCDRAETDAVAGGDDVALLGAESFEQSPRGALVERAVVGLDGARQSVDRKHAARPADGLVHVELDAQARLVARVDLGAADGAVAGQIALAADALARGTCRPPRTRARGTAGSSRSSACERRDSFAAKLGPASFSSPCRSGKGISPIVAAPSGVGKLDLSPCLLDRMIAFSDLVGLVAGDVVADAAFVNRLGPRRLGHAGLLLQSGPLQERFAENLLARLVRREAAPPPPTRPASNGFRTCAWRPTGCRPGRSACPSPECR